MHNHGLKNHSFGAQSPSHCDDLFWTAGSDTCSPIRSQAFFPHSDLFACLAMRAHASNTFERFTRILEILSQASRASRAYIQEILLRASRPEADRTRTVRSEFENLKPNSSIRYDREWFTPSKKSRHTFTYRYFKNCVQSITINPTTGIAQSRARYQ